MPDTKIIESKLRYEFNGSGISIIRRTVVDQHFPTLTGAGVRDVSEALARRVGTAGATPAVIASAYLAASEKAEREGNRDGASTTDIVDEAAKLLVWP